MRTPKRLLKDRSGNFGIITALIIIPIVGSAGLAIDYGTALEMKTKLMGAADAAALGAIAESSPALAKVKQMQGDGEVDVGETDGKSLFLSQRDLGISGMPIDVSVKVTKAGGNVTSNVAFTITVPTTFMQVLGINTINVSGVATAVYGGDSKSYTDFYLLLDNTPSMGIGATKADMDKLVAATSSSARSAGNGSCAFACHIGYTGGDGAFHEPDPNNIAESSTYQVARKNNVTLRIDVVTKAASELMNEIQALKTDQYRIAAYTFGSAALEPGYRIQRVVASTIDMTTVSTALSKVGLMTTDHHGFNQDALTSFDTALPAIGDEIGLKGGGSGASSDDPRKTVLFITDGMNDSLKANPAACGGSLNWKPSSRCVEPVDVKYCDALKKRNVDIAILYTTYLPIPGDSIWDNAIKNVFASKIGPALKACASDDLFAEVGPNDDMKATLSMLFSKAATGGKSLRLTQ